MCEGFAVVEEDPSPKSQRYESGPPSGLLEPTLENYLERVHPDDAALVRALHDASWSGKVVEPVDYWLRLPDGTYDKSNNQLGTPFQAQFGLRFLF